MRYVDRPTNTFLIDWPSRQIKGMDAGLAAMRQAVEIILRNERYRWQIYNKNFGSELEGLIGCLLYTSAGRVPAGFCEGNSDRAGVHAG